MIRPISRCLDQWRKKGKLIKFLGEVEMCAPTMKHMGWVALKTFNIMCCVNVFSTKSTCTMAYCPVCFEKRETVWQEGENEEEKRKDKRDCPINRRIDFRAEGQRMLTIYGANGRLVR